MWLYIFAVIPLLKTSEAQPPIFQEDSAVLTCTADALPEPTVVWLKDKKLLNDTNKYTITTAWTEKLDLTSSLKFRVTSSDYGDYVCEIRNSAGTSQATISLKELGRLNKLLGFHGVISMYCFCV